jgi:hypothetical protein
LVLAVLIASGIVAATGTRRSIATDDNPIADRAELAR